MRARLPIALTFFPVGEQSSSSSLMFFPLRSSDFTITYAVSLSLLKSSITAFSTTEITLRALRAAVPIASASAVFDLPVATPGRTGSQMWHPRRDNDPGHRGRRQRGLAVCREHAPS